MDSCRKVLAFLTYVNTPNDVNTIRHIFKSSLDHFHL